MQWWVSGGVTSESGNLPARLTSFVGRRCEISEIHRLLGTGRLLTLTGAGGVGKTRLALEVAAASVEAFPDGVWWVDLAPVHERQTVVARAASALRLPDLGTHSAVERLVEHLAERTALLLLDNCEHLVGACAELIKNLLAAAPGLRVLATSRHTLGITGEQIYTVPPLSPEEAVELLRERAVAVRPDFRLDAANQVRVARLCADLEGLPLAIELAASRLRTLTVDQVTERLEDRFALLTGGCPTKLPHQRTLRGTLDWSYELCTPAERVLWNRLSVFAGGFSLEAAEDICAGDGVAEHEVLDLLDRLVAQSIVLTYQTGDLPRYRLLETIRRHGRRHLAQPGQEHELVLRHRDFFLALAQRIDWDWYGPGQLEALARLHAEHTNLLAALDCETGPETRLALVAALRWHWCVGGFLSEGRRQFDRALGAPAEPTPARARALMIAVWVAQLQGDLAAADRWMDEADALCASMDDPVLRARARGLRGVSAFYQGRCEESVPLYENALATLTALGDEHETIHWLLALAFAQTYAADPRGPETSWQVLAVLQAAGDRWGRAQILMALGQSARDRGDQDACGALTRAALENMRGFNDYLATATMLEFLAWSFSSGGDHEQAARLLGTAHALCRKAGTTISALAPQAVRAHTQCEGAAVNALGQRAYAQAFTEGGHHDSPGGAIPYALDAVHEPTVMTTPMCPLTLREREVAALVAAGRSNRQIASTLGLSKRTADGHVQNILRKLDFGSRAQIASWWSTTQEAGHRSMAPSPT